MNRVELDERSIEVAKECEAVAEERGKLAALRVAECRLGFEAIRRVSREGTAVARRRALYLLSLWDSAQAFEPLSVALLNDPSAVVRHEAAFFLGALKTMRSIEPLARALRDDPNELVRHEAAEALWDMDCNEGIDALSQAQNDPSLAVRETVAMALAELGRTLQE